MRQKRKYQVLAFSTTHDAMAMESWCREHGIPGRTIPLPGQIAAGCGLSWRMETGDYARYENRILNSGIPVEQSAEVLLYAPAVRRKDSGGNEQ